MGLYYSIRPLGHSCGPKIVLQPPDTTLYPKLLPLTTQLEQESLKGVEKEEYQRNAIPAPKPNMPIAAPATCAVHLGPFPFEVLW